MYLKALEIQGFKSFPDRTKVNFDRGITAVVGPNGSGKSNISDAVRWVLGETSVKQLRGGGKMENVIFGGTQKRNAMGYAAVQLILDNKDRRLEVDADEVTIGRRYYRSGESEYSINGQSVRLRDVYEMLLDTGLGRDGYSIIGQGRIDNVVATKSTERREIFEEASGIARYRYRKNDAERQLLAAEENLVRLRDIVGELESRVGPLKAECAKAEKFLQYSGERKSLEVTLWVDTVRGTRENLRGQQRKIDLAQADYDARAKEIETIDAETEEIRAQIIQIQLDIDRKNGEIRALQEEFSGSETRVAVLESGIERSLADIAAQRDEIARGSESAGEIEQDIRLRLADIARAEEALAATNADIAGLEGRLSDIQQKSLATGERKGEVTARLADMTDRITALRVSEASAESASASAAARLQNEQAGLQTVESELAQLDKQRDGMRRSLAETEENLQKLGNIKGGLDMKLAARAKALAEAGEAERAAVREAENAQHRIAMLKDLERSLDGFQASVKAVMKAAQAGRLRGVIGPVSTILSVQSGYEVAIETALGFALQNVVVQDETAAKAAMAHLKQTGGGRATFLPLDTVQPRKAPQSLPAGAQSAQRLVSYDGKYENIVSSLLAGILVVEDIGEASRAARQLGYKNRVVTRDGQVINAGGSFTGGSVSRSAGLFSRKQEIEDLQQKIESLQKNRKDAEATTARLKAEVEALSAEATATASEAITAGGEKIRCETELTRIEQSLAAATARGAALREACDALQEQIARAKTEHTLSTTEQQRLSGEIEKLTAELSQIAGDDDGFLAERESLSAQLQEKRLAAMGHQNDAELHRQRIETLKSQTGQAEARSAMLAESIKRLEGEIAQSRAAIAAAGAGKEDIKGKITAVEGEISALRGAYFEKEKSIKGQTDRERAIAAEREALGMEIGRLTEQKATLEGRYDSTIAQLWDEYELTLSDAEKLCVEFTSASDLNRRVRELRGKIRALGNVNVGAIEEYAEVSERYEFLTKQVQDVEESKGRLEAMIAELSGEMTALFAESFAAINRSFTAIFRELFGGGSACLSLTDPDDLLESGIEIEAAPPGKVIKDLTALSGGEKALVAICIYFAILAVNPSPFCVLDEIEAALDDANIGRYAKYLRRISPRTQFIVITHRRGTMEEADVLYGVTMQEDGISKILRLSAADVDPSLVR